MRLGNLLEAMIDAPDRVATNKFDFVTQVLAQEDIFEMLCHHGRMGHRLVRMDIKTCNVIAKAHPSAKSRFNSAGSMGGMAATNAATGGKATKAK